MLLFTKKMSQIHEMKVKSPKLMPSKTIIMSNKPVAYYNNCSITNYLVPSGDIETNPGPPEADSYQVKSKYDLYYPQQVRYVTRSYR